jgi:hypothetical protein
MVGIYLRNAQLNKSFPLLRSLRRLLIETKMSMA